jgi:hypothetical protein
MSKIDINDLYTKFYLVVNDIIYDIHSNNYISKYLFYCDYTSLNMTNEYNLPLTMCLGGGGFIQYNHIFKNEKIIDKIILESKDYDISFSFGTNNINNQIINRVKNELKSIYDNNIKSFTYNNLTQKSFKFTTDTRNDRLHCKIECR